MLLVGMKGECGENESKTSLVSAGDEVVGAVEETTSLQAISELSRGGVVRMRGTTSLEVAGGRGRLGGGRGGGNDLVRGHWWAQDVT